MRRGLVWGIGGIWCTAALSACVGLGGLTGGEPATEGPDASTSDDGGRGVGDDGSAGPADATTSPDAVADGGGSDADAGPDVVVGSVAECMVGGNVLYMNGDVNEFIHPGPVTIRVAAWTPSMSPGSLPTKVSFYVVPSDAGQGTSWSVDFGTDKIPAPMAVGVYEDAERAPFAPAGKPGLSISGDGRGCNVLSGRFQVVEFNRSGSNLTSFTATFEQHCEKGIPALRGCVHFGP